MQNGDALADSLREAGWTVQKTGTSDFIRWFASRPETQVHFDWSVWSPTVDISTPYSGSAVTTHLVEAIDIIRKHIEGAR